MSNLNQVDEIKPQNNKGQSLLEFVLILLVVSALSFSFLSLTNERLGQVWVRMINVVSNDNISVNDLN